MKRRDFVKGVAAVPAAGALLSSSSLLSAEAETPQTAKATGPAPSEGSKMNKVPGFAEHFLTMIME